MHHHSPATGSLTQRLRDRHEANVAARAAMTPAEHAAEDRSIAAARRRILAEHREWLGLAPSPARTVSRTRARGAGRPRAQATRSSVSSGDDGPGEPPPLGSAGSAQLPARVAEDVQRILAGAARRILAERFGNAERLHVRS